MGISDRMQDQWKADVLQKRAISLGMQSMRFQCRDEAGNASRTLEWNPLADITVLELAYAINIFFAPPLGREEVFVKFPPEVQRHFKELQSLYE